MNAVNKNNKTKLITFSIIAFVIIFMSLWSYSYYKKATNEKLLFRKNEFAAVTQLKLERFKYWTSELIEDAETFRKNQLLGINLKNILSSANNKYFDNQIRPYIEDLKSEFRIKDIYITDAGLKPIFKEVSELSDSFLIFASDLKERFFKPEVSLTEIFNKNTKEIFFLLTIPITDAGTKRINNLILIKVPVKEAITSLLHKWPTPFKTYEVLVMNAKGEMIFLEDNNVQYKSINSPMLSNKELIEIFEDKSRFMKAVDYKSKHVLALESNIPNTEWELIIKLEIDELHEMVFDRLLLTTLFVISFILLVAVILYYLFKNYQLKNIKQLIAAEKQKEFLENNFNFVLDQANDVIVTLDDAATIININQKVTEVYGYSPVELIGKKIFVLRADGNSPVYLEQLNKARQKDGIVFETIHKRKDGTTFPVEISSKTFTIDNNLYYQSIIRNITSRKKQELLLRDSRKKLSTLMSNLPGMAYKCLNDDEWTMQFVSKGCFKLTGYKPSEFYLNRNISYSSIIVPDYRETIRTKIKRAIESKKSFQHTYQIKTKNGITKWVWEKGQGIFNSRGELLHIEGFISDISDLKNAEGKVLNLNRLYSILSQVNQAIVRTKHKDELFTQITNLLIEYGKFKLCWIGTVSADKKFITPEKAAGEMVDYLNKLTFPLYSDENKLTVLGESISQAKHIVINDLSSDGRSAIHKTTALENGIKSVGVFPLIVDEAVEGVLVLNSGEINSFDENEVNLLKEISSDISFAVSSHRKEEKRLITEINLKNSEENFRTLYESAPLSYQSLDSDGNILEVNDMFTETFGYSSAEIIGKNFAEILSPASRMQFKNKFESFKLDGSVSSELIVMHKNGEEIITSINGKINRDAEGKFKQSHCILTDITKQKLSQNKIAEQEESYRTLTQSSLDAIYVLRDKRLLMVNPAWEKMFDYTSDEVVNDSFDIMNIVAPESVPYILEKYNTTEISKDYHLSEYEFKGKTRDGKTIFIDAVVTEIMWKGEKAFQGIYRDITDKKFSEFALKESELKYRQVIENASDLIYTTDKKGNFTFANATLLTSLGVTLEEVLKHNFRELVLPEYKNRLVTHYIRQVLEQQPTTYIEFPFRTNSNEIRWFGQNATIKYENGSYIGFHVIARDITQLKKTELALKENEEKYRTIFENNPHPMWVYDLDTLQFIEVNDSAVVHYGYTKDEFLSMTINDLCPLEDLLVLKNNNNGNKEKSNGKVIRHTKKDGTVISVEIVTHKLPQLQHRNCNLVLANDITERLEARNELIKAKEHAEEMNRLKTSFLNNMSHEIRTPMVGILGFTSILYDEVKKPQLKEMCETILNSGKRLMDTINLILDLSRIEANKIEVKVTKLDLVDETKKVLKTLSVIADDKKLLLEYHPLISSAEVLIDRQIYTRILNNIVGNAIKYTPKGKVTVEINTISKKAKRWIELKVIDTGIGIPKESQQYIFDEFRQVSEGLSRRFEGTGLGLTITKKLLELMHGEISVESEVGKGSTFTVMIPTQNGIITDSNNLNEKPEENITGEQVQPEDTKPVILLVENDPASIDVTKFFLRNRFDVDVAQNGQEALAKASSVKYDAILMDINLGSGMTGLEATKEIKSLNGYESTPIIALTAFAMEGDKEEFLAGGCTHYLSKPFDKKTIIELLTKLTYQS